MKPAGLLLLIPAGLAIGVCAADAAEGLVSRETKARIREGLPTYQPAPTRSEGESAGPDLTQTTDPNVLILPKLTVKESRLPRDANDRLLSKRDFKRKMENLYSDAIAAEGPLSVILNSFTIPILSPSKAARGRAIYQQMELDRLDHVNETSKAVDPDAARKYRQELDNTHTTRPAGIPLHH